MSTVCETVLKRTSTAAKMSFLYNPNMFHDFIVGFKSVILVYLYRLTSKLIQIQSDLVNLLVYIYIYIKIINSGFIIIHKQSNCSFLGYFKLFSKSHNHNSASKAFLSAMIFFHN